MKYYNKTRTIEQKVTDREILDHLKKQNVLLQSILEELKKQKLNTAHYWRSKFYK
jgi:hypothetical protein